MYHKRLVTLWVVVCLISTTMSQTAQDSDNTGSRTSDDKSQGRESDVKNRPPPNQKPPVWLECMATSTGQDVGNSGIKDIFETWCSNYDKIVECLTANLPASSEANPFDFFISLNFDPDRLNEDSQEFCGMLKDKSGELSCSAKQNQSLATVCGHAFTRGLIHIYDLFQRQNTPPPEVLTQIACDVTTQTTFCIRQTLPECSPEVQTTLINYYALFTNRSCVAGEDYQPPSPKPRPPETIVFKCAAEASDSLGEDPIQPTSVVESVVLGLQTDCKTYNARFSCYDRELRNITNFLDFWLSLTFDLDNAIMSQKAYCGKIKDFIIPKLNAECFNKSHPALTACELGFRQEVEAIRMEWVQNPDFDGVQLQTLACRTSVTRAICLGDAIKHCGDEVAVEMRKSEMGILPDVCERLLTASKNGQSTTETEGPSETGNPGYGTHSGTHHGMSERPVNDMGSQNLPKRPTVDNNMAGGSHMHDDDNKSNDGDDDNDDGENGVGVDNANHNVIVALLSSFFLAYKFL